ncbi:MAG: LON peptidase substrate-binding domain-containing protein [Deltaproteobacteria bacterium]
MSERSGHPAAESLRALLGGSAGTLKIFPLPGVVVFPGTPAPFHVFEPRYRAMTEDALEGDRLIAVATLLEADDEARERAPVHPVAGAGFIEADERLPDGRYNILLRGVARVRLVEEILSTGKPYREFRAEVLEDEYPAGGPPALAASVSTLERCVLELARGSEADSGVRDLAEAVARMRAPGHMADAVAAALIADVDARLAVLEELRIDRRLALVVDAVAELLLGADVSGGGPRASA